MPSQSKYDQQRKSVTPPHIPLKALRVACGLTLDQVCERLAVYGKPTTRATLSAIEGGHRGASQQMCAALEHAYRLPAGSIDTKYAPRSRSIEEAA